MKTRKSFYRALRKVAHNFKWEMSSDGMITGHKIDYPTAYNCAITAVYNTRHNAERSPVVYNKVGKELGLSENDVETIVSSFDNNHWQPTFDARCRKALIRAIGLDSQADVH